MTKTATEEYDWKAFLRRARGLATELRNVLEEVAGELATEEDEDLVATLVASEEWAEYVSDIEDWLDLLPINEDGTSAAEGYNVNATTEEEDSQGTH